MSLDWRNTGDAIPGGLASNAPILWFQNGVIAFTPNATQLAQGGYGPWQQVAPVPTRNRMNFCAAANDSVLLMMAGSAPSTGVLNDVQGFDGARWASVCPNAPWAKRQWASALYFQDKFWIMGGVDPNSGRSFNDVWASDDNGASWRRITPSANWTPRFSAAVTVFNNQMWILGGSNSGTALSDAWVSDDGATWAVAPPPSWGPRFGSSAAGENGNLYIISGTNGTTPQEAYATPDGGTWVNDSATMPNVHGQRVAACGWGGNLFLLGDQGVGLWTCSAQ